MKSSTPRERMLAALNNEVTKYVPCSFMLYKGLQQKSADYLDFLQKQIRPRFGTLCDDTSPAAGGGE